MDICICIYMYTHTHTHTCARTRTSRTARVGGRNTKTVRGSVVERTSSARAIGPLVDFNLYTYMSHESYRQIDGQ